MGSKPDILVYIDWYLPGYKAGGPITSLANMVAHLSDEFQFHIITRDRDYMSDIPYPDIQTNEWLTQEHGERVCYLDPAHIGMASLKRMSRAIDYDAIYINGLFSWHFSIKPLLIHRRDRPRIMIAPRGMLRKSALAIKDKKKTRFIRWARRLNLYGKVSFHATDDREREDVTRVIASDAKVFLAPNLPKPLSAEAPPREKSVGELRLMFIGRVAKEKNLLFALECLHELEDVQLTLDIYGAIYDQQYWEECMQCMKGLPAGVKAEYRGTFHPREAAGIMADYHALFLPTAGENFGHIILEVMMTGRPVLISDQTPWVGLEEEGAGYDLPLSEPSAFTEKIRDWAFMDEEQFGPYCRAAYMKAARYCKDPDLLQATKALFSQG